MVWKNQPRSGSMGFPLSFYGYRVNKAMFDGIFFDWLLAPALCIFLWLFLWVLINEGSALTFLDHSLSSICEMIPSLGGIRVAFIMLFLIRKIGLLQLHWIERWGIVNLLSRSNSPSDCYDMIHVWWVTSGLVFDDLGCWPRLRVRRGSLKYERC